MKFIRGMGSKYMLWGMALLSQLLLTKQAFAQAIGFAPPPDSDMSRQFVSQLFGGLLTGGADAFGASITTLNGAVLIVGGILVAYTIFAGTLGTAHDGEMLGKKFSSVWVPIRTALGTALVMPVLPGGYCVMQALVMWLIMQGAALGNMIWTNYMAAPPALVGKVSPAGRSTIKTFVQDVFLAQVCVKARNKAAVDSIIPIPTSYGVAPFGTGIWFFGDQAGIINPKNICGEVVGPKKPEVRIASSAPTSLSSLNGLNAVFKTPDLNPIYTVHMTQIQEIINRTGGIADRVIVDPNSANVAELDTLVDEYATALEASASGLVGSTGMSSIASTQGWFMAGTWATQIIFMQSKINAAMNSTGQASPKMVKEGLVIGKEASQYASQGYRWLSTVRPELVTSSINGTGKQNEETDSAQEIGITGKVVQKIMGWVSDIDLEEIKTDPRHPLILMNQIGDRLLNMIIGAMMAAAVVASVAGIKIGGTGLDITGVIFSVYSILAFPMVAFISVAGMLAYILPNTPFLIWVGIIIGWTIMVVEAIIAAPLWAVMHLHPHGDDMTGRGGNGYMLVLGLLLRPALIIFGLIAAIVLSEKFGQFINIVFFDLFSANTMSGGVGFFAMLFGMGLYATLMFLVIKNTFSLMHIIPDQLMRWIGGGGEQLGQYANQIKEGSLQQGAAVATAAGGYMMKGALEGASSTMNQIRTYQKNKEAADAQKEGNKMQQIQSYQHKDASEGAGAGDIDQRIDHMMGNLAGSNKMGSPEATANSLRAMKAKSEVSAANQMLGGRDSPYSMNYRQSLANKLNENVDFETAHQAAYREAFDQKFGDGSYDVAQQIARDEGGDPKLSMQKTAQLLDNKLNNLVRHGQDEDQARGEISQMMQQTKEVHQNSNGSVPIRNILGEQSKALNERVGLNTTGRTRRNAAPAPAPSVANPPPPPPPPAVDDSAIGDDTPT